MADKLTQNDKYRAQLKKVEAWADGQSPDLLADIRFGIVDGTIKPFQSSGKLYLDSAGALTTTPTAHPVRITQGGVRTYKTPAEALRFIGAEPDRSWSGQAVTSAFAPVAQRQIESIDQYGANSPNISTFADVATDVVRDAARTALPMAVSFSRRNPLAKAGMAAAANLAGNLGPSATSVMRDEDYNAYDVPTAARDAAFTAGLTLAGDRLNKTFNPIEKEIRASLKLGPKEEIGADYVKAVKDRLKGKVEDALISKNDWIEWPYRKFTEKYSEAEGRIRRPAEPMTKGKIVKRDGKHKFTDEEGLDWYARNAGIKPGTPEYIALKQQNIGRRASTFLDKAWNDPGSDYGVTFFPTGDVRKTPRTLYSKDPAKRGASLVAKFHEIPLSGDNLDDNFAAELLRDQSELLDPKLNEKYQQALAVSRERRRKARSKGNTAVVSPKTWDSMNKFIPKVARGVSHTLPAIGSLFGPVIDMLKFKSDEAKQ